MKVAFDMSSVMWTSLLAGKSLDALTVRHDEKDVLVNDWAHGYENAINLMKAALVSTNAAPKDALLVFEGMSSKKQRLMIDSAYKENRASRPDQAYTEFQTLRTVLEKVWRDLGACAITQNFVEGDDILAWLQGNIEEELLIVSNDGDLLALQGRNAYDCQTRVQVAGEIGRNKFGDFPFHLIPVYKALVGDSSDNIKGCPGFGPKAFLEFIRCYGDEGLESLLGLLQGGSLDSLSEDAESDKLVKKIYDQRETVLRSYRLAKLRPEWVDTLMHPLKFSPGVCLPAPEQPDERLAEWYATSYLVTGAKFASALAWAKPHLDASEFFGLDIETSTPPESDDWLAAQSKDGKVSGVDVIASRLTGLSLTFGKNLEKTLYFPVDHAETDNCGSLLLKEFIFGLGKPLAIQNAAGFELPVLKQEWGVFLPNALDTRIESVYVDENLPSHGLKQLSLLYLDYKQTDYATVTTVQTGTNEDGTPIMVQKKMKELTARHVLSYACDDSITCAALNNFFKLKMGLEHHYDTYTEVEIDAMYMGAEAFLSGVPISHKRLQQLAEEDEGVYAKAWDTFRAWLVANGWEGTLPPTYTKGITAAEIKDAFLIATGEVLETKVRTPAKLVTVAEEQGASVFARLLERCLLSDEGATNFTTWIRGKFKGEPVWNSGSGPQKAKVLYEVLGLPVRLRNPPTDSMRAAGQYQGGPKTDALALAYALAYDAPDRPEIVPVINAMRQMQTVLTRQGLYYKPYPKFVHWQTGRIHSSVRQSDTNTRRWSASKPNVMQMSKHPKADGETPKFREVILPHKKNAVVVSMDFAAQELRVIADYSQDENMLACFVGDNKKDMHLLTALGILRQMDEYRGLTYAELKAGYEDRNSPDHSNFKDARTLGKKTNFTSEYGAMAPKLAQTLLVSEEIAQGYLDAREEAFPQAKAWKEGVVADAKVAGVVHTKMGAVRHLADAFMSSDRQTSSRAERQSVNFEVQSSSAEMTKLALGAMYRANLTARFDCQFYFPVHDEVVWSCVIEDLEEFIPAAHECMVRAYADMSVPIISSIALGKSFGPSDQIEIGEEPTAKEIQEGLSKMRGQNALAA